MLAQVLSKRAAVLAKLYTDKVDVYRFVKGKDEEGGNTGEDKILYTSIPCRLSKKRLSATVISEINSSTQEFMLFVAPDVDIVQNDKLKVRRDNFTYTFRASHPFSYQGSHKEIFLSEVLENEDQGDG